MEKAIAEAQKANACGEVPIGAVIVKDGKIIAKGYNKRQTTKNALHHAELIAIDKACKKIGDWRLENCQMYVTLEPCPMCAGAIIGSRIEKVFFAAKDKTAEDGLFEKIISSPRLNHTCTSKQLTEYEDACAKMLTTFFKSKRKSTK